MSGVTTAQYLQEKANNFRRFLTENNPDAELQQQMRLYDASLLIPTVATILVPLSRAGILVTATEQVLSHLSPDEGTVDAVRDKIHRYLTCFVEVVEGK